MAAGPRQQQIQNGSRAKAADDIGLQQGQDSSRARTAAEPRRHQDKGSNRFRARTVEGLRRLAILDSSRTKVVID